MLGYFNIWRSKVLILILGQLIEYYIEKMFMEKFSCPKANFGPLHRQGGRLPHSMITLYFILHDPKVTDSLGMILGRKAWPNI